VGLKTCQDLCAFSTTTTTKIFPFRRFCEKSGHRRTQAFRGKEAPITKKDPPFCIMDLLWASAFFILALRLKGNDDGPTIDPISNSKNFAPRGKFLPPGSKLFPGVNFFTLGVKLPPRGEIPCSPLHSS
jgi:hypothetical protein